VANYSGYVEMNIQVRFFASLRERLQLDDCELQIGQAVSVEQVWNEVTNNEPLPANLLCAVNMEYVTLNHEVHGGDEVAFFPPVTGG
jgi:molybdopterin synthase sulfur carrier subunit